MDRLEVNSDLFANLASLPFDKWVAKKLSEPVSTECGAKTIYQLMMAVFREKQDKDTIQTSKGTHATTTQAPSINIPSQKKLSSTTSPGVVRMSKLARIGELICKRLITSHFLRGKYHSSNKANAEVEAEISETSEVELDKYTLRACRDASKKMEDCFSLLEADRAIATL